MAFPVRSSAALHETVEVRSVYREFAPSPDLAGVVACTWSARAGWARALRLLPGGSVDLVWDGTSLAIIGARARGRRDTRSQTAHVTSGSGSGREQPVGSSLGPRFGSLPGAFHSTPSGTRIAAGWRQHCVDARAPRRSAKRSNARSPGGSIAATTLIAQSSLRCRRSKRGPASPLRHATLALARGSCAADSTTTSATARRHSAGLSASKVSCHICALRPARGARLPNSRPSSAMPTRRI